MAPEERKKKGKSCAPADPPQALELALEQSTVINQEGLDKVCPTIATDSNEWKATTIHPASWLAGDISATKIPIFLHALIAGLIPPSLPSSML